MNSGASTQKVVAELIGTKIYHPLISLRVGEQQADGRDETPTVKGFALYRKSLQIIPSGTYTLRFELDGIRKEYEVRVANKSVQRADDKDQAAA